ncbi:MAG: glycosyltransferase [Thermaceae bacterium]|nr:glycosyltransferase [Thermaceae bacterium]
METKSPSIVFLITALGLGGAETQVVRLAAGLAERGWRVSVVSMVPKAHNAEALEQLGVPVFSLNMPPGFPDPRGVLTLVRYLRQHQPTILHAHMVHANLLARVVRLLAPVKVVISTAHNIDEGGRWRELAYRLSDPLANLTTQVSQAGLERYVRVGAVAAHKIRFVPNGINTAEFRPNPLERQRLRDELGLGRDFVWLAAGRLTEAKDYPNLLEAFQKVQQRDSRLLIGGTGELLEALKTLVQNLGIAERVGFLGLRKDMPSLMNAADGFVLSSAWEGLPMVLLEASACGLPMVATDVGGNREAVHQGVTGFLVPPKDSTSLASAMSKLMALPPSQRRQMGEAARKFVQESYSLESVLSQWEAIYHQLSGASSNLKPSL